MLKDIKPIKIFILVLGTRGDLELFLWLGRELRRRGHSVVFGSSEFHEEAIVNARFQFVKMGDSNQQQVLSVLETLTPIKNLRERTRQYYLRWLQPQLSLAKDKISSVGASADYFISNLKLSLNKNGAILPGAFVTYDPPASREELKQYGSHKHSGRTIELVALNRKLIDTEGLWEEAFHFTGFWHGQDNPTWSPPETLAHFITSGPPPVVVTMGSMTMFDTEKFFNVTLKALELSGQRAVIVSSWSGLGSQTTDNSTVYGIQDVPYDWLFPRASCVIHHGGAGTVAATLKAGIPSIILPQILCQEEFSSILAEKNLAAGVFDVRSWQPEQLADAIRRAVDDIDVRKSAHDWQSTVTADSGTTTAVDLIEEHWREIYGQ